MLHQTFMPSVLVETGFLTNDSEGAYLNSIKGQSEMGTAIAESIVAYREGIEFNTTTIDEEVIVASPDPEKALVKAEEAVEKVEEAVKEPEVVVEKTEDAIEKAEEVVGNTENTAEEFAKNPGENPMAVKTVAEDPVTESLDEKRTVEADIKTEVPPRGC